MEIGTEPSTIMPSDSAGVFLALASMTLCYTDLEVLVLKGEVPLLVETILNLYTLTSIWE